MEGVLHVCTALVIAKMLRGMVLWCAGAGGRADRACGGDAGCIGARWAPALPLAPGGRGGRHA